MTVQVLEGDALDLLRAMDDCSVDAVVTDPPYGLSQHKPDSIANVVAAWVSGDRDATLDGKGFMGKAWDAFVPPPALWDEVLRVLKPGGHALVFAGSRTVDVMGLSLRLAGFELRDTIEWIYGSGFPKSLDVSKAIDKAAGAEREVVSQSPNWRDSKRDRESFGSMEVRGENAGLVTAPATREAERWDGWGTALKPAHEPILVARKPLAGTVAANVLEWGTGALNIDACRVKTQPGDYDHPGNDNRTPEASKFGGYAVEGRQVEPHAKGRWPANIVLDGAAADALDQQSGMSSGRVGMTHHSSGTNSVYGAFTRSEQSFGNGGTTDTGGASRYFTQAGFGPADWPFFYCAKPSRRERNSGLDAMEKRLPRAANGSPNAVGETRGSLSKPRANIHPTVKPVALMRHLVRLATPPDGTVLDPFTGSGTTLVAAIHEHVDAVGCEIDPDYATIARARVTHAQGHTPEPDVTEPAATGHHPTLPGV